MMGFYPGHGVIAHGLWGLWDENMPSSEVTRGCSQSVLAQFVLQVCLSRLGGLGSFRE